MAALAAYVYLSRLPPGYTVTRSIRIDKPRSEVYAYVHDLANWPKWSPWSLHDPATEMSFDKPNEQGGGFAWKSKLIGQGSMHHRSATVDQRIDLDLAFIKPFKNKADVSFLFQGDRLHTELTWTMQAKAPLFFRPMVGMLTRMIGNDFALGLGLLQGQLNPSAEHPAITFDTHATQLAAQTTVGTAYSGPISGLPDAMALAYPKLWASVSSDNVAGAGVAAYHSIDEKAMTTVCDITVPVNAPPAGTRVVQLPGGQYYQTTLHGHYQFLGPAWNAAFGHARMLKFKTDKSRPMLEIYQTKPHEVPHSNDWITVLAIPVK